MKHLLGKTIVVFVKLIKSFTIILIIHFIFFLSGEIFYNFLFKVCRVLLFNAFQYSKHLWIFDHIMMRNRDIVVFLFDAKLLEQTILHQSNLNDVFFADFTILYTS